MTDTQPTGAAEPGQSAAPSRSAWRDVPPRQVRRFAALALEEVPALAQDILREIRAEYPGLPVVLDDSGEPMALVGIRRALEGFVQQLASQEGRPRYHLEVFQEFGRGEGLHGRSLDSLQAIYRLGVRLAWRRLAEIGQQIEIPPPAMYELAESGFEYLDGLVDQSVRGYAEAAAREAGERLRLQRKLMELLLSERRADPGGTAHATGTGRGSSSGPAAPFGNALGERAARVGWQLPERVAVGVLLRPAPEAVAPAVGEGVLLDMEAEQPRMVVPDPEAAGRPELLRRAMTGWSGAIGPPVPLADAAKSLRWAEAAVGLMERGLLPAGEVLHCTEHTEALVLLQPEELIEDLARRCLAPLEHCGPAHGRRLAETLLAWLETRGGAPEVAARLGVHPQTVRYRLRQIRELWGDEVDDPDRRFELELVLRARRLRGLLGRAQAPEPGRVSSTAR
ncbi:MULTISPECIES: helix-turn-helix domain-containing protein [Streptomyces]|uniref:Helix-turn-helix domain-containing protein n=1 Tax=Streptomyces huasconensis TaxID=1854574 RepID=A0ABV3LQE6_9ACTN|nr:MULTISPECIES: PucR family transcriptional regulator [Streptomyces]UFQ15425.1 helix-turn-helix domain-containing protein [Streptomyces huasconensis]WCL85029.1 helix-turn-helix domain-containing protein [Streptomyces sp. JCM 35825]